MKKYFLLFLFCGLSLQASPVDASPSEKEVKSLADNLGWTTEDLEEYLSFKGLKISDFDNIRVLKNNLEPQSRRLISINYLYKIR